jgi:hypothetical protein
MKKAWNFALVSLMFIACAEKEPVATEYKKQAGAAQAEGNPPAGGGTSPGGGTTPDGTANAALTAGRTYYTSKSCSGCHGADGKGSTAFSSQHTATSFQDLSANPSAHTSLWPTTDADKANLLAYVNSISPK